MKWIVVFSALLMLAAPLANKAHAQSDNGALGGGIIGALVGAGLGLAVGHGQGGAAIAGGIIGAATGAIVGNELSQHDGQMDDGYFVDPDQGRLECRRYIQWNRSFVECRRYDYDSGRMVWMPMPQERQSMIVFENRWRQPEDRDMVYFRRDFREFHGHHRDDRQDYRSFDRREIHSYPPTVLPAIR